MSEVADRAMARFTSVLNERRYGKVFFSYIPTRQVFLAGSQDGLTQEQFHEKRRQSLERVAGIFQRIATPKAKGYKKVRGEAFQELVALMPEMAETTKGPS